VDSKKFSITKFDENVSSDSQVALCGRTGEREEASSCLPQFFEKTWNYELNVILACSCVTDTVLPF
jgi:hypothetical protein